MSTILYSRRKKGHYDNYEKVFIRLIRCDVESRIYIQLIKILLYKRIIFFDIDGLHLLFMPLIILRNIIGKENILLSIRTAIVLDSGIRSFFMKKAFKFLRNLHKTRIISIHRDGQVNKLKKYANDFIYCPQYWDLPYLNIKPEPVNDLVLSENNNHQKKILVFGSLNSKKLRNEWVSYLKNNDPPFQIIFAGHSKLSSKELRYFNNSCVIDRYISDGEMIYLFKLVDYISCYRSVKINQPSGIFGRAMQLKKPVIVKKGDYLSRFHTKYNGLLIIENLLDLGKIDFEENYVKVVNPNCDDSKFLKNFS